MPLARPFCTLLNVNGSSPHSRHLSYLEASGLAGSTCNTCSLVDGAKLWMPHKVLPEGQRVQTQRPSRWRGTMRAAANKVQEAHSQTRCGLRRRPLRPRCALAAPAPGRVLLLPPRPVARPEHLPGHVRRASRATAGAPCFKKLQTTPPLGRSVLKAEIHTTSCT